MPRSKKRRNLERELVLKHKISWKEARELLVTAKKYLGETADEEKLVSYASAMKEGKIIEPQPEPEPEPQQEEKPLEDKTITTNLNNEEEEHTPPPPPPPEVVQDEVQPVQPDEKTVKEAEVEDSTATVGTTTTMCGALDCMG